MLSQELYNRKRLELEQQLESLRLHDSFSEGLAGLEVSTGELSAASSGEGSLDRLLAILEARIEAATQSRSSDSSSVRSSHGQAAVSSLRKEDGPAEKEELEEVEQERGNVEKEEVKIVDMDKVSFISELGTDSESGSRIRQDNIQAIANFYNQLEFVFFDSKVVLIVYSFYDGTRLKACLLVCCLP